MEAKANAAKRAVEYVRDGMVIGLGSGSTVTYAIEDLGERIRQDGLKIVGVPTSSVTNALAERLGIPLIGVKDTDCIDLTIDGADEVDGRFNLIKGGGGALVREKLVAAASKEVVIICDESKLKPVLGIFPLPVAVVQFAWEATLARLKRIHPNVYRRNNRDTDVAYVTDDDCYILDMHLESIEDPESTERQIKSITGVVDVGLFVNLATRVVVGRADGTSDVLER